MVSVTFNVDDNTLKHIENFSWVNWSELARLEIRKKLIFEKYLKTREISNDEQVFCGAVDWHPVDELPLKKSFISRMKKQSYKKMSLKDIDALMG
jgi:hypothetical protein